MKIVSKTGAPITDLDSWFEHAPPEKGARQWVDGRSAKEMARAWVGSGSPEIPPEVVSILGSHPETKELTIHTAIPEFETPLDSFRGKGRQHDVLALADGPLGPAVIGIEAKADEEFGPPITPYRNSRLGTASNVPARIDNLLKGLFGTRWNEDLGTLRYQLVHSLAGTLIETAVRNAKTSVFLVFEFVSDRTRPELVKRNNRDLSLFADRFSSGPLETGLLTGPFAVPGHGAIPRDAAFYMGKVRRRLQPQNASDEARLQTDASKSTFPKDR
jgi:hypothetical protein